MRTSLYWLALGAAGMLGACTDSPTGSQGAAGGSKTAATANTVATLLCTATVAQRTVSCGPASASGGAASHDVIIGGQGQYIGLASSNVSYSGSVFSFDATVENLIPQPLATADGTTSDPNGVEVFFASGPTVTGGTGAISVRNADGVGAFTGSNQPYFAYAGTMLGADHILSKNETSTAKTWQLNVDPTVTTFTFLVYVDAVVQHPQGYVNFSTDTTVYATQDSAIVLPTQTHAFAARVLSFVGRPVSGATVSWATSNSNVATVDGSGNVTAVAPGHVTITATSDTLVSSAAVSICPDMSVVGTAYTMTAADTGKVCLGGTSSAAEFVAVPYIGATSGSVSLNFLATGGIVGVSGPPNPNLIPTAGQRLLGAQSASDVSGADASGVMFGVSTTPHLAFQQQLRRGLPALASISRHGSAVFANDHRAAARLAVSGATSAGATHARLVWNTPTASAMAADTRVAPGAPSRTIVPGFIPSVGDSVSIDVATACNGTPDNRYGLVQAVSQHAIIVADTANPANGFTTAQYDSIGAEFDSVAYSVVAANFGAPTDQDANGHIVIFYSRAVNELTPSGKPALAYGYFNPKDVYPATGTTSCATSNEGELLYALVPDPAGAVNTNVRSVQTVRDSTMPALTHNLEHLTNAWRRTYVTGASALEEPWLDEGLADEAQELAFFQLSQGLTPRSNINVGTLTGGPSPALRIGAFNQYELSLFNNLSLWMRGPDTTGAIGHTPVSDLTGMGSLPVRGVVWDFLRYASDRVNGTESSFWFSLVNSNLQGTSNLQHAIGGADPFAWARDFSAAVYADDNSFTVASQYTTPTWNFRSIYPQIGGYGLITVALTNNVASPLTLNYGGASYLRFGVPANTFARFTTTTTGSLPSSFMMTIVRTK